MTVSPIDVYRRQIERELQAGNATEHTHRPALKTLIESLASGVTATNEPKRVACGAPDFSLTRKKVPLGHIETKDVGVNLQEMERGKGPHGEQFIRYRDGLPNWILTDYLEFRWYVAGEKRLTARLAEIDARGKLKPTPDGVEKLTQLLDAFIKQEALTLSTAKDLAQRMAGMTRIVRDLIIGAFEHEKEKGWLHNWLAAFREVLLPELDEKQFADMFAQTLAYGLFAAKVHSGSGKAFSREMAAFNLPKTNPFLRKLFSEIAGVDMPETIDWAVDDIVELLKHADLGEILKDFGKGKGKEDPVVHFYETFLAAYDPKMRELRGVYYTPEPVVSYIVRSIEHLLKTRFNRPKGLADENTLILDPACGTGTFLYFVIQQIRQRFAAQKGAWDGYVAQHLLNRLFGFELLMAPYAVAHLKLGMELQETGYSFGSEQRLGIYLTNTLEEAAKKSEKLFAQWISDEANAAAGIKRDLPIMVVMGNPPYSGHSANRGEWIRSLVEDYKRDCPELYKPAQAKWLQDDYVKFVRWGQWRIEKTGAGILAFITNHGYLDNPTFRGMRQRLMRSFSDIYILNLHGSSKKREVCADGSKDENVFDIQQGVTIGVFVRQANDEHAATVHYADFWGLREDKYTRLFESDIQSTGWRELNAQAPSYLFIPQDADLLSEYQRGWKLPDAMNQSGDPAPGVVTTQDEFAISWDPKEAKDKVRRLLETNSEAEARAIFQLCTQAQWDYGKAKDELKEGKWENKIVPILYRPFDIRWTVWDSNVAVHRRERAMRHMLGGNNLGVSTTRTVEIGRGFEHVLCSRMAIQHHTVSMKEVNYLIPLYLYPGGHEKLHPQARLAVETSPWPAGKDGRRPNLNPEFVADLEKRLGLKFVPEGKGDVAQRSPSSVAALPPRRALGGAESARAAGKAAGLESEPCATGTFGPEDVFNYIYAIFHSPTYRSRYAEFLKSDFPRVPLTSDVNLFRALCEKGAELVALHLLESPTLENPITGYPVKGSNVVEKGFPKYLAPGEPEPVFVAQVPLSGPAALPRLKEGRVYINAVAPVYGRRGPGVILSASEESRHFEMKKTLRSAQGDKPLQKDSGQYFEGVPPEVWNFHIGGYQVCEKWLKDRRGRTLSYDDLEHYCKVVTAISETTRLMAEIDAAIPKWPIE
jgi:predicted helicase